MVCGAFVLDYIIFTHFCQFHIIKIYSKTCAFTHSRSLNISFWLLSTCQQGFALLNVGITLNACESPKQEQTFSG